MASQSSFVGADTIPIGKGADAMLPKVGATQSSGWADRVKANIVSRELGVQPIVTKVSSATADAGIVYATDVPYDPKGLSTVDMADAQNAFVPFSIAPVSAGKNKAGASSFIEFMTKGEGHNLQTEAKFLPSAP